ncbi:FAD-dependent oxidoreductase [Salipaludibacillus daqingensis]|uniref:FAD-dependent oxidoreductase n=1 Tax=Salipaludibacillus daqingensis TaxID=3041001 RepID=UPI002476F70E|nr:FAD-dependent oxidoreductase [Salipaludibacillus daqingensis]
MEIPMNSKSLWHENDKRHSFPILQDHISTDVTIIGAGTTGITSAYLLAKQGIKVTLIEAGKILDGTTGYTTAKVTSQHGPIYQDLLHDFGKNNAKLYYEANEEALTFIRKTVKEQNIECDLSSENALLYTTNEKNITKLIDEEKAYKTLGIDGGIVNLGSDLPFRVVKALMMRDQLQFNPVKFFAGLIPTILKNGGRIFEHTRASHVKDKNIPSVKTTAGHTIKSNYVLVSSHFPFNDQDGLYFSRLHVERSYCLAVKTRKNPPRDMYLSIDHPSRSLRYAKSETGESLLLVGGEGHKSGKNYGKTTEHYERLKQYTEENFGVEAIPFRWSAQDLKTLDNIPYIGPISSGKDNVLVATGYGKWGMSNGVAAAMILSDRLMGKKNRYSDLFDPRRSEKKKTNAATFLKENMDVGKEFIGGKLHRPNKDVDQLSIDEGAIVHYNGNKVGAYKDSKGELHLVETTCPHMGCDTSWNDAERSWDCPCHGSRFSYTGEILEGPAVKPLKQAKKDK